MINQPNVNRKTADFRVNGRYRERGEIVLDTDLAQVRTALDHLGSFCIARKIESKTWRHLEAAVAEALNNAIQHGCAQSPVSEGTVTLRWQWTGDVIEVEVGDPGRFMPSTEAPTLPADPLTAHGRGFFVMKTYVDEVVHETNPEGHRVLLRKKIGFARSETSVSMNMLHEMENDLEAMAEDLTSSYESIAALFYFSERLATAGSFAELIADGLDRLQRLVDADRVTLRLIAEDGTLALQHLNGVGDRPIPLHIAPETACAEWRVVRENREQIIEHCGGLELSDPLRAEGVMAFCAPVFFQKETFGVLCVERTSAKDRPYFTAGQLGLMRGVSDFLGIAHKNCLLQRRRESEQLALRELEIASQIQRSLLPAQFPRHARFEIFGASRSATQVGGDYFDALPLPDGGVLFVIADVMGKGLPAAIPALIFRTAVHARLGLADRPDVLLQEVNHQLSHELSNLNVFITAQVATIDAAGETLTMAGAGHCPILQFTPQSKGRPPLIHRIKSSGVPIGVLDPAKIGVQTIALGPHDILLFLTDGVYETEGPEGRRLDLETLALETALNLDGGAAKIADRIFAFVDHFSDGLPAADDQTLLIAAPRG